MSKNTKEVKKDEFVQNEVKDCEKWRIFKNLILLGLAFQFLLTSFYTTSNFQSSINEKGNLGTYSLGIMFFFYIFSSLFLPPFIISKLQYKGTIIFSISSYAVYLLTQFYPTFETLIPSSILLGICSPPLWAAGPAYVATIAEAYANMYKKNSDEISRLFFGIFFLCVNGSHIWGNFVSHFVLTTANSTSTVINENKIFCGSKFCPTPPPNSTDEYQVFYKPDPLRINILAGILLSFCLLAGALVIFGVDPIKRYEVKKSEFKPKWNDLVLATVRHWNNPWQILLIPVTIWLGVHLAFIASEFTMAYVSCAWGIERIGLVLTTFGVCGAFSSILIGLASPYVSRLWIISFAASLDLSCLVLLLNWYPTARSFYVFYIFAGLWGVTEGIWQPQMKALYGVVFPNSRDAGFCNVTLWLSLGLTVVYLLSSELCMDVKIYTYLGLLIVAICGYVVVEIKHAH